MSKAVLPQTLRLPGPAGPILVPVRPAIESTLEQLHRRRDALDRAIDWLETYQRLERPLRKGPIPVQESDRRAQSR